MQTTFYYVSSIAALVGILGSCLQTHTITTQADGIQSSLEKSLEHFYRSKLVKVLSYVPVVNQCLPKKETYQHERSSRILYNNLPVLGSNFVAHQALSGAKKNLRTFVKEKKTFESSILGKILTTFGATLDVEIIGDTHHSKIYACLLVLGAVLLVTCALIDLLGFLTSRPGAENPTLENRKDNGLVATENEDVENCEEDEKKEVDSTPSDVTDKENNINSDNDSSEEDDKKEVDSTPSDMTDKENNINSDNDSSEEDEKKEIDSTPSDVTDKKNINSNNDSSGEDICGSIANLNDNDNCDNNRKDDCAVPPAVAETDENVDYGDNNQEEEKNEGGHDKKEAENETDVDNTEKDDPKQDLEKEVKDSIYSENGDRINSDRDEYAEFPALVEIKESLFEIPMAEKDQALVIDENGNLIKALQERVVVNVLPPKKGDPHLTLEGERKEVVMALKAMFDYIRHLKRNRQNLKPNGENEFNFEVGIENYGFICGRRSVHAIRYAREKDVYIKLIRDELQETVLVRLTGKLDDARYVHDDILKRIQEPKDFEPAKERARQLRESEEVAKGLLQLKENKYTFLIKRFQRALLIGKEGSNANRLQEQYGVVVRTYINDDPSCVVCELFGQKGNVISAYHDIQMILGKGQNLKPKGENDLDFEVGIENYGLICGRRGVHAIRYATEKHVYIKLIKDELQKTVLVRLTGKLDDTRYVHEDILKRIQEAKDFDPAKERARQLSESEEVAKGLLQLKEDKYTFLIKRFQRALLIGKEGSNVNRLQEQYGVVVRTYIDDNPSCVVCELFGQKGNVISAYNDIQMILGKGGPRREQRPRREQGPRGEQEPRREPTKITLEHFIRK